MYPQATYTSLQIHEPSFDIHDPYLEIHHHNPTLDPNSHSQLPIQQPLKNLYLSIFLTLFHRLISVLKDLARGDWQLGSMVCQILWNFSGKITSTNSMFGEKEAEELTYTLEELLGEFLPFIALVWKLKVKAHIVVDHNIIRSS